MVDKTEFIRIAITPPNFNIDDVQKCIDIINNGDSDLLHLRIPEASELTIRKILSKFPHNLYNKIKIHSHFNLVQEFGLRGAHLNKREPTAPNLKCKLSKSCHTIKDVIEAAGADKFEYVTLSPVFDSISKMGYKANPSIWENELPANIDVIALGGITPDKFDILKEKGFAGAAMLGYFFH
ncbi:MAG: thiamine phosphate synthase [Prevotella sp.]|nr:thiamine phosphate synthase [Bacteroides sp.]MCM1365893.1 thiamine phosphate synthase [Prevotella sp.]